MKNSERPGRPPAARLRHPAPAEIQGNDGFQLSLVDERTEKERGYDPYDTAARKLDAWRWQRKRA